MNDRFVFPTIGIVSLLVVLAVGVLFWGQQARVSGGPDVSALPLLNAVLNATSALLLAFGYLFIRQKNILAHKVCMLSAFAVSTCFLISYVIYHYQAGSKPFAGTGFLRLIYFPLLISHILLAAVIVPLALTTLYRAWAGAFERHKRIARFTLPIWLYVSVTGVLVYLMLYWASPQ